MAKPPPATPASDVDGVHQDQRPIDVPENSDPELGRRLEKEQRESKGRPKGTRA